VTVRVRHFASIVPELRRLSAWARECAAETGIGPDLTYRIEVCLNEAAANIIRHGYLDGGVHEFVVGFEEIDRRVRITITDDAPAFDPLHHPALPDFGSMDDAPVGGFGIHLLRSFASALEYRRDENRNVLTLWFERDMRAPTRTS